MLPDGPIVVYFPSGIPTPVTPGEKFARWTEALLRILDALVRYLPWPLLQLMRLRVQRINARFQALARKIEAGELRERPSRAGQVRARLDGGASSSAPPGDKLPRGKGWMVRLCGYHMAGSALHLQLLLADPEIKAMIASSKQLARLLRPFIEMLGIDKSLLPPPDGRRRGDAGPVAAGSGTRDGEAVRGGGDGNGRDAAADVSGDRPDATADPTADASGACAEAADAATDENPDAPGEAADARPEMQDVVPVADPLPSAPLPSAGRQTACADASPFAAPHASVPGRGAPSERGERTGFGLRDVFSTR